VSLRGGLEFGAESRLGTPVLVGILAGGLEILVERLAGAHHAAPVGGLASMCLVGGLGAALLSAAGRVHSATLSGRLVASFAAALPALPLLIYANTHWLPGVPFLAWRSLALDAAIVAPALALAFYASPWVVPDRWRARLSLSAFVLLGTAGAVVALCIPSPGPLPSRGGSGPDLALVVLDSVRRDRLGVHGRADAISASLDAWARDARIYERAYAASSWTAPSVQVLLASDAPEGPLAGRLAAKGYTTVALTDNPHLGRHSALLRSFDRVGRSTGAWRELLVGTALGRIVERLDDGADSGFVERGATIAQGVAGPLFLFAHLMDAHGPFERPPIDGVRRPGRRIVFPFSHMPMTEAEAEDIRARYDAGVRSATAQAVRLLEVLGARKRPFLAIITADHGESLGEGGRWYHAQSLAPELLAVPLIVAGTGVEPGRVGDPVGHQAVPSTLLRAAGDPCAGCIPEDLRTGRGSAQVDGHLPPHQAFRISGRYKLEVDYRRGTRRLYDVLADPDESRDLASAHADVVAKLAEGLRRPAPLPSPSPEDVERLRALGYIQ